jgi:hypothetical protein
VAVPRGAGGADPERQLRLNAHNSRVVKTRIGPLLNLIRTAAPLDPEIDALRNLIQLRTAAALTHRTSDKA